MIAGSTLLYQNYIVTVEFFLFYRWLCILYLMRKSVELFFMVVTVVQGWPNTDTAICVVNLVKGKTNKARKNSSTYGMVCRSTLFKRSRHRNMWDDSVRLPFLWFLSSMGCLCTKIWKWFQILHSFSCC
jgi:hypothetical protein